MWWSTLAWPGPRLVAYTPFTSGLSISVCRVQRNFRLRLIACSLDKTRETRCHVLYTLIQFVTMLWRIPRRSRFLKFILNWKNLSVLNPYPFKNFYTVQNKFARSIHRNMSSNELLGSVYLERNEGKKGES